MTPAVVVNLGHVAGDLALMALMVLALIGLVCLADFIARAKECVARAWRWRLRQVARRLRGDS